jgi:hypothetical protein
MGPVPLSFVVRHPPCSPQRKPAGARLRPEQNCGRALFCRAPAEIAVSCRPQKPLELRLPSPGPAMPAFCVVGAVPVVTSTKLRALKVDPFDIHPLLKPKLPAWPRLGQDGAQSASSSLHHE